MRIRVLTITILLLGAFLSAAGAALAVTGMSSNGDVSVAQYGARGDDDDDDDDDEGVIGVLGAGPTPPGGEEEAPPPEQEVAGVVEEQTEGAGPEVTEQVGKLPKDELPFTGYAAIPILLAGLALLTVGAVVRRRLPRTGPEATP